MTTALQTVDRCKDLLAKKKEEFSAILAKGQDIERFNRQAVNCVMLTPKLLNCDAVSFLSALMKCASLNLAPDSNFGHVYLLPYGNVVQVILGYRGMLELARRSGKIATMYAEVVHKGDHFKVTRGLTPTLYHEPKLDVENDEVTYAYAVAKFKDGSFQFEVMTRGQIDKIRARSKAANSGPWVTDFPEMAKKTVFRRLAKYLPMSPEYQEAVILDNEQYEELRPGVRESRELKGPEDYAPVPEEPSKGLAEIFDEGGGREPGEDDPGE